MKINGIDYTAREMTAGDLAVIAPLINKLRPVFDGKKTDLKPLIANTEEIILAAEHLLNHNPTPANLREKPLHEAIAIVEELIVEWLSINGKYVSGQVAEAVTNLSTTIITIVGQVIETLPTQENTPNE